MFARFFSILMLLLAVVAPAARAQEVTAEDLLRGIDVQIRKGSYGEALNLANRLIQLVPNSAQGYISRGGIYDLKGDYAKAIDDFDQALVRDKNSWQVFQLRGAACFKSGRIMEAVADFDKVLRLDPAQAPYHWQRGIALYEAGKYEIGRRQFEVHSQVNSNDVENAAWYFLCVAKSKGFDEARKTLLTVTEDKRVPMMAIYSFYQGKGTIDDIFNAARAGSPSPKELDHRLFYANLYVGMFFEARDGNEQALSYVKKAVEKSAGMDYMADVARIHAEGLQKKIATANQGKKKTAK